MDKEKLLLDTLNLMIQSLEPIYYFKFNQIFKENSKGVLEKIESENNKIGLYSDNVDLWDKTSTIAIISTITDCLIDKRLAFIVENEIIKGVKFYDESKEVINYFD